MPPLYELIAELCCTRQARFTWVLPRASILATRNGMMRSASTVRFSSPGSAYSGCAAANGYTLVMTSRTDSGNAG